jgi:hypothetical protein
MLHLHATDSLLDITRPRPVTELTDSLGWIIVQFVFNGQLAREMQYGIGKLLGGALAKILARIDPAERNWSFAFRELVGNAGGVRLAPDVLGSIEMDIGEDNRPLPFTVQQVQSPAPDGIDAASLGIDPAALGPVNLLLSPEVHDLVLKLLPLSGHLEEGGFLLGRIRPAKADPEQQITQVTYVTPAASAGASAVHFTFTPDSFQEVNRVLGERDQDEELVGWYHTHLFSPSANKGSVSGLSSIDVDTHQSTFRRAGQVAGLINLFDNRRLLRFFGKAGDSLKECPVWIGDDRSGYRPAGTQLGGG